MRFAGGTQWFRRGSAGCSLGALDAEVGTFRRVQRRWSAGELIMRSQDRFAGDQHDVSAGAPEGFTLPS